MPRHERHDLVRLHVGKVLPKVGEGHDHAVGASTALEGTFLGKRSDNRLLAPQPIACRHREAVQTLHRYEAGVERAATDEDDTGSASTDTAASLRSGLGKPAAQDVKKRAILVIRHLHGPAIDLKTDAHVAASSR